MRCPSCGHGWPVRQKFCGECGGPLPQPGQGGGAAAAAPLGGLRKPVTIVFCDIVGSTSLAARLGADRMHGLVNEFLEVAMERLRLYDGDLNQFTGDGFMALFGAPVSHEDHSRRAAYAALEIRDALAGRTWRALPSGEVLEVRIGLNTGTVVFGAIGDGQRHEITAIGDAANVAARLQAEASPGSVVCSATVLRSVQDQVLWRGLGARTLRGKDEPVEVFELLERRKTAAVRRRAGAALGLLGREAETAALLRIVADLRAGRGAVVTIEGDAGLGKTRLLDQARDALAGTGVTCAGGGGVSHGHAPSYWPFREVVRACLGLGAPDANATDSGSLDAGLRDVLGEAAAEARPFFAALLGLSIAGDDARRIEALDGLAVGHQIFRNCVRLVEAITARQPLAVLLDDWQWADESSAALVDHLLPLAARLPLLIVVAGRPEAQGALGAMARRVDADAALGPQRRRIVLSPMNEQAMRDLLRRALGPEPVQPGLEAQVLARAGGNPFYLEEIVRALQATGAIAREGGDGAWHAVAPGGAALLPETIEGVILARIDRQDERLRKLLRIAAVIGRTVDLRVLAGVAGGDGDLAADIETLVGAGLLAAPDEAGAPTAAFQHPLIQEAAYASLIGPDRREIHRRVGECIERLHAGRLEAMAPVLAMHFMRAEQWPKAREHLLRAGAQAGRIAADAEALECFENALRAAEASAHAMDPLERARLAAAMSQALYRRGRNDAALEHALGALATLGFSYPSTRPGTRAAIVRKLAARTLRRLAHPFDGAAAGARRPADDAHLVARELFEVVGTIDYFLEPERFVLGILTMLEEAERRPPSRALAISTSALALICDSLGYRRQGAALHARAARVAAELGEELAQGYCSHMLGLHQYGSGRWREALETLAAGRAQLERAGHLRLWASCTGANYFVLRSMGDPRWMDLAEEQLAVAQAAGDAHARAWGINARGVAHLYRGDHAAALPLFEEASAAYEGIPDYRFLAGALARRGLCQALCGRADIALGLLERSRALVIRHRVAGTSASAPLLVAAEAYLAIAETMGAGGRRGEVMKLASAACARASRHARGVGDESAAEATRLAAVRAWLDGEGDRARKLWRRAIDIAQTMGAGYVLARVHDDLAVRAGDAAHARDASACFEAAGAAPPRPLA